MTPGSNQTRPRIASLATAVPPHRVAQDEAMDFFQRSFDIPPTRRDRLKQLFLNAEIETRYAAAPVHWYEQAHSFELKNDLYIDRAIDLLKQVAIDSLTVAGLACRDVDALVTVSSTGVAVPALDVRLMEELPFRRNVQRLPVFGLGCAGGALGLARAAACALARRVGSWRAAGRGRWLIQRFRAGPQSGTRGHVSSSRLVKPSMPLYGTGLSCCLRLKGYAAVQAGSAFGR